MQIHCDYFPACPGCQLHKEVELPPVVLELQKHFDFPLFHKEIIHWRTRAKLAVRSNGQIGLFKRGTHDVIDISDCPLHHPAIKAAIKPLKRAMQDCAMTSYNEQTRKGTLRYVQFVVERSSGLVQLTLVVNQQSNIDEFVNQLWQQGIWHSIWINVQPLATNRIFGDKWLWKSGKELLFESLGGNQICLHPANFGQAHLSLFEDILSSIKARILPQKKVVEYYAGVGVIGLTVASVSRTVICVEINPFAKPSFEKSTRHANVSFIESATEEALHLLQAAEVVIVDPPRKGLEAIFIDAITQSNAEQLIYMSCGPLSFLRDSKMLIEAGWELEHLEGYLLFPGTDHIEMLGFFKRKPDRS